MNAHKLRHLTLILPAFALAACRTPIAESPRMAAAPSTVAVASCGYSPAQCEVIAHLGTPDRLETKAGNDGRTLEVWEWTQPAIQMTFAAGRLINPRPDLRFYRQLKGLRPAVNTHVFD
jgi:hypothetical protein